MPRGHVYPISRHESFLLPKMKKRNGQYLHLPRVIFLFSAVPRRIRARAGRWARPEWGRSGMLPFLLGGPETRQPKAGGGPAVDLERRAPHSSIPHLWSNPSPPEVQPSLIGPSPVKPPWEGLEATPCGRQPPRPNQGARRPVPAPSGRVRLTAHVRCAARRPVMAESVSRQM
jgi:hypothetical protein